MIKEKNALILRFNKKMKNCYLKILLYKYKEALIKEIR